jgi:superfamily II DNA or RNA helicase
MTLQSFYIKSTYSKFENPYSEFFIPALSNSNAYWRFGGFFNSKNLAVCAEGIQEFLKNDGKIKLILSPNMTREDIDAIKAGINTPEKFLKSFWEKDFDKIKDKIEKDHLRALSWLIAQNPTRLEIKIAIFRDDEGYPLTGEEIIKQGIADQTFGIFHDEEGNSISFKGTIKNNTDTNEIFYDFNVFKNWIDGQKEFVKNSYSKFINLWEESGLIDSSEEKQMANVEIIDLPEAIREDILQQKPNDVSELTLLKPPKLNPYQNDAVNSWLKHGNRGIFEMATGTGKTFCAISCLKEIEKLENSLLVIVPCPTQNLVNQWNGQLKKWGYESNDTLSGKKSWEMKLERLINDLNFKIKLKQKIQIVITTYDTFSSETFRKYIKKCDIPIMIIADEVHASGSEGTSLGLLDEYKYRLGLSATPDRYFDEIGTKRIMNFFEPSIKCEQCENHGSIVFSFELKDAIPKYLAEYEYFPYYVELTDDELEEYKNKTKAIAMKIENAKDNFEENELIKLITFERANIIKNAINKIKKFEEIILKNPSIDFCIVYCAPSKQNKKNDQMSQVQSILNKIPISNHRIKSGEIKLKEQIEILDKLESGSIKIVESIQMLDEGLDIPALKNAILLASTGNPKQFIQRRGRVLRKWNGVYPDGTVKDHATIHDIFVIPYLDRDVDPEFLTVEKKIIEKELKRHEEMARISRHPQRGLKKIEEIRKKYELN